MLLFACLIGVSLSFAEPDTADFEAVFGPSVPVNHTFPSPLTIPEELLHLLPADLERSVDEAKSEVRRLDEMRRSEYHARQAKQMIVHLTPERTKIYTPNRPPRGIDLWDDVLPHDELYVMCDGLDQTNVDGQATWVFQGNVRVIASRFMILCCREAKVVRTEKFIKLTVSGGNKIADDLEGLEQRALQPSHPSGMSLLGSRLHEDSVHEFSGGCLFSSATIQILPQDGGFLVKMEPVPLETPRE